ncbi:Orotidine 5'-phosphate decarboxylase [Legionella massiliensis]|uniref:Orotidine 5'-phosphate decarboxylase n=1 Tax=Legionella massiliensis TaxID=1034943 RepID=A0A078L521_9GAMM|nr:orotidine-5'-phosphate decarboxylase [Legionella massiliensis]CDZ79169.1 Orotidine 5'-phosphate decarboxylase [Legionella massiliensis]CEE14907.1 Orotidine 5'-phosphate decarboxylase [Legionella massiliensis]
MNSKLIVALDFADQNEALTLVEQLDPTDCALKVGSEMFCLFGTDFVRRLVKMGFKIFLDLKFYDIPNTVAQACRACAELEVWMINVHASGGFNMMQAARKAIESFGGNRPLLTAVTVLTSMGPQDLPAIGLHSPIDEQVERLAQLTLSAGLDGVVCSAYEVPLIKKVCGQSFLTVTPGIRLSGDNKNDQTRVMTPDQAIGLGSDFLVVGRSITAAEKPAQVVEDILAMI